MNIILAILLSLTAILGQPSQPASQPSADPASFTASPFKLASTWVPEALADAGVDLPSNVTFLYQNEYNCGAELSPLSIGGCTLTRTDIVGHYIILISPELAYTAWGNHILFHELAHTMGANECEAEAYAHQFEATALWSYPECEESPTA